MNVPDDASRGADPRPRLGTPRLHLRTTGSTSDRARALAAAGAPHGTLVTAGEQLAGRGRHGRTWSAPPGRALLMSLVLRDAPALLALSSAVAVADVVGAEAAIKWPNDVLVADARSPGSSRRAARRSAGSCSGSASTSRCARGTSRRRSPAAPRGSASSRPTSSRCSQRCSRRSSCRLGQDPATTLAAYRERDGLLGRDVRWQHGDGVAAGVDDDGRLLVDRAGGGRVALDAGEVHLVASSTSP